MSCNKTGLGGCVGGGEGWWSSQQRNQQAFINPAWKSFPLPATTGPKAERSWKDVYAQVLLLLSSPLSLSFSPPSAQQLQWRGRAISRPEESKQHKVTHASTTSWEISLKKNKNKNKETTHSLLDGEYWVLDGARAHKEQKPCTYYCYYYYYYNRCRTAIPVQFLFFFSKTMYFITTTTTTTTTSTQKKKMMEYSNPCISR